MLYWPIMLVFGSWKMDPSYIDISPYSSSGSYSLQSISKQIQMPIASKVFIGHSFQATDLNLEQYVSQIYAQISYIDGTLIKMPL